MNIGVVSLGNLGSAIANLIAANGYDVLGWEYNAAVVAEINDKHTNARFLPDIKLSPRLIATTQLNAIFEQCRTIFIALPSAFIGRTLEPTMPKGGSMNLLVTGGAGFIGSNFIRYWLERYPDDQIVNLDLLTYAGTLASLHDVADRFAERYTFVRGDIGNIDLVEHLLVAHRVDTVVNFAAESHNSRAILHPAAFFRTNVLGTQGLLEACRRQRIARVHHVSTCEVFGDLALDSTDSFGEDHPYRPRTPYNAAKAGGDLAARSYFETFGLPITISTCANNFGPYQFPEKLIPLFIANALDDRPLPLYQSSANRREWLYVGDHCRAIDRILKYGRVGELYNIGSGVEQSVEQIADRILMLLDKPHSLKTYVPDRPGHDRRYLLNSSKIRRELGWAPEVAFDEGMRQTVAWYAENVDWWRPLQARLEVVESSWASQ